MIDWDDPNWGIATVPHGGAGVQSTSGCPKCSRAGHNVHESSTGSWLEAEAGDES